MMMVKKGNVKLCIKNNVPFISCISKINNTFIEKSEDLYIAIICYNIVTIILWHQEVCGIVKEMKNDDANKNVNNRINSNKTVTSKSFEYKTKSIGTTPDDNNTLDTEVVVPLKYLSNFWRSLDLRLINCEIEN